MNDTDQPKDDTPKMSKGTFSLAAIGTLAATVSLILLLLGYGVSLAVESRFGIPHATLYDSPSDIIDLATVVLMVLITTGGKAIGNLDFYIKAYRESWPVLLLMIGIALSGFGVAWWWLRRGPRRSVVARSKLKGHLMKFGPPVALTLGIGMMPMVAGLMALVIVLACLVVCVVPIFGFQAGGAHLKEWVVNPSECRPLAEELNGRKGPFVQCVIVRKPSDDPEKPDVVLGEGRVVLATTKYMLLWVPKEHPRRVPISDAVVEPVSSIRQAKVPSQPKGSQGMPTPAPTPASAPSPVGGKP